MIAPALRPENDGKWRRPEFYGADCGTVGESLRFGASRTEAGMLHILLVGLVAGFLARLLSPGANNPTGFILTIVLGIAGAFLATFVGQAIGHYSPDQGAGFITATIGAVVVLFIWNRLVVSGRIGDPGAR
jgi:uncharacterized membrane protein YeaQ/YmgE (transglycosylase-associated protein family)